MFVTRLDREGQFLTPTQNVTAKNTQNTKLQNLRQDLSGNVDAMLQFTDKGFCRVILSPESRASCNAAFIESFQLPSSPSIAPG